MPDQQSSKKGIEIKDEPRISRVWIVPIAAAIVGGWVTWESMSERGPLVEIRFSEGRGVEAGKTEVKHKDIVVGVVEEVTLADDLDGVLVRARLDDVVEPFLGDTTSFWIVSANISSNNFSGLGTLLSGSYIEIDWSGLPQSKARAFEGLDVQPLTPPGAEGRHFKLRSPTTGSVTVGSPVNYRGIRVGQIESKRLTEDFQFIEYQAFVEAPYDSLLSPATHFWNASGVSLSAGANGLSVNVESLETLIAGGVAFGDLGESATDALLTDDAVFKIFPNREAAKESRFELADGEPGHLFMAFFEDSIAGLEPEAPVQWQGIRIGTVRDVVLDLGNSPSDARVVFAVLELQPSRIGLEDVTDNEVTVAITQWVRSGMRAQLASGNIISGKKIIRFVDGIGTDGAEVDYSTSPYPTIPTAPSEIEAVTQNVEQIVSNIAALPLDDLILTSISLLKNADALLANPDTQKLPTELVTNLNSIADAGESTLAGLSPESELYVDLANAVRELRDASRSLSALAAQLEEKPNSLIVGK